MRSVFAQKVMFVMKRNKRTFNLTETKLKMCLCFQSFLVFEYQKCLKWPWLKYELSLKSYVRKNSIHTHWCGNMGMKPSSSVSGGKRPLFLLTWEREGQTDTTVSEDREKIKLSLYFSLIFSWAVRQWC